MDNEALDFQLLTRRLAVSISRFVAKFPEESPALDAAFELRATATRLGLLCTHYAEGRARGLIVDAENECISVCYWLELVRELQPSEAAQVEAILVEARSIRELLRAAKKKLQG
jgi:hypothetical protein